MPTSLLPVKEKQGEAWYVSPFRPDERTPSFKIDLARNVWYDHGRGEGGTIIDFTAALYGGIGVSESLARMAAQGVAVVDGQGASRVVAEMLAFGPGLWGQASGDAPSPVFLAPLQDTHLERLTAWKNDRKQNTKMRAV